MLRPREHNPQMFNKQIERHITVRHRHRDQPLHIIDPSQQDQVTVVRLRSRDRATVRHQDHPQVIVHHQDRPQVTVDHLHHRVQVEVILVGVL